jgi:hypothetical protein
MKHSSAAVLIGALLAVAPLHARDAAEEAARAAAEARDAVTVFVDVDFGAREDGAAKDLNRTHQAFERQGYELLDVTPYTENGDLQGFFVSYRRRIGRRAG